MVVGVHHDYLPHAVGQDHVECCLKIIGLSQHEWRLHQVVCDSYAAQVGIRRDGPEDLRVDDPLELALREDWERVRLKIIPVKHLDREERGAEWRPEDCRLRLRSRSSPPPSASAAE